MLLRVLCDLHPLGRLGLSSGSVPSVPPRTPPRAPPPDLPQAQCAKDARPTQAGSQGSRVWEAPAHSRTVGNAGMICTDLIIFEYAIGRNCHGLISLEREFMRCDMMCHDIGMFCHGLISFESDFMRCDMIFMIFACFG